MTSWWAVLALPVALLIGFAFGAVGMAATTWIRGIADFDYVQLALVPMHAAVRRPSSRSTTYPGAARWLVELSPLYHGVALERGLMLGQIGWRLLAHLPVLLALGRRRAARCCPAGWPPCCSDRPRPGSRWGSMSG